MRENEKDGMSRVWLITGASSGFGRLWTEAALERGDQVIATVRDAAALEGLRDRFDDRLLVASLDVTDRERVIEVVAQGVERFGRLDVLVNNAGYGHWGMVEELAETDLRRQMETNFFGAVWVTQAVLPVMREQRAGRIIQVTSEGGVRAYPGIGAYHASKWAVEGLSESLAQEVAPFGVHVTCLEPGPYATGFGGAVRSSERMSAYDPVREAETTVFVPGDPAATVPALFRLVEAERPPRRLILGATLPQVVALHEERIATWREWEAVSAAAQGEGPRP